MMPCKFCHRTQENPRGLKQVGKTRYEGRRYWRAYRCQDCGAIRRTSGELIDTTTDEWEAPRPDWRH